MNLPDPDAPFPSFGSGSVYQVRGDVKALSPLPPNNLAALLSKDDNPTTIDVFNTNSMTIVGVIDLAEMSPPIDIAFSQYSDGRKWYHDSFTMCGNFTYILSSTTLQVLKVEVSMSFQ